MTSLKASASMSGDLYTETQYHKFMNYLSIIQTCECIVHVKSEELYLSQPDCTVNEHPENVKNCICKVANFLTSDQILLVVLIG